jgi:hypothetical protein
MRCPKCGFISFDHLTACAKCGKDIAEVASELQGTSIKVEAPMFLSSALAAFADREAYYGGHAIDDEGGEGIDFSMDDETGGEEAITMSGGAADIDFSMETEEAEADISLAGPEAGGMAGIGAETESAVDFTIEAEADDKGGPEASEESFEELDLMDTAEEVDEGGLEFDLEDFIEDMDSDNSGSSGSDDIDLDLDDEK